MAVIDIDENRWPIVIITLSGKETKEDIQSLFLKLKDFQTRNEEFCFVLDLREVNRLSPDVRDILMSLLKSTEMHEVAGSALVVSSAAIRIYLTVMFWLSRALDRQKSHYRHKTVSSLNEAYEWSRNTLSESRR